MRNGQVGSRGIDVHGRDINLNLGRNFFEIKPADAARAEAQGSLELDRNPLGVFSNLQREAR